MSPLPPRSSLDLRISLDGVVSQSLSERLKKRVPRTFPLRTYYVGWLQAAIQLLVFCVSGWYLLVDSRPLHLLAWSVPFGWSWFALLMVGHDAAHRTFSPWKTFDRIVAFLTLDCLLVSERCWRHEHQLVHHAHPLSTRDTMRLHGSSVGQETWHLFYTVVNYMKSDFTRLLTHPTPRDLLGSLARYALLASLLPLALVPALLFLIVSGNYLGLLTHAAPDTKPHGDALIRSLRTTWDFFPRSPFLAGLITGGLNAHATHHALPHLPRGAQPQGAALLQELAGSEYRSIDSAGALWDLFRLRHGQPTRSRVWRWAHPAALAKIPLEAGDV